MPQREACLFPFVSLLLHLFSATTACAPSWSYSLGWELILSSYLFFGFGLFLCCPWEASPRYCTIPGGNPPKKVWIRTRDNSITVRFPAIRDVIFMIDWTLIKTRERTPFGLGTVCLEEKIAEPLVEDLVEADLAGFLQILDHHRPHAWVGQDDFLACSGAENKN